MWLDRLPLSRFERLISRAGYLPLEHRSLLAGSARAVRLGCGSENSNGENPVHVIASGVVAPLTFLYAWCVLRDAHLNGVKRLYFLARDGLIFYSVASVLAKRWGLDIDLRYLYCSRVSLLLPSFQRVEDFERYWIPWGYLSTISLKEIAFRLKLDPIELCGCLSEGEGLASPESPLDPQAVRDVMNCLDSSEIRALIQDRSRGLYESTIGYLTQEGLCDPVPYALVDTGWKGTSQYAISSILEKAGQAQGGRLSGYYLGLNVEVFRHRGNQLRAFLFDWTRSSRNYRLYNFLCFEMLCAANHGRTKGYVDDGGVWQPELYPKEPSEHDWIIDVHHERACQYATYVSDLLNFEDFPDNGSCLCRDLMSLFISAPASCEAAVYGEHQIASEMREGDMQRMAPEMSLRDFMCVVAGRQKIQGYWPQASFVRSGMQGINFGYGLFLDMKLLDLYRRFVLRY